MRLSIIGEAILCSEAVVERQGRTVRGGKK
jgi:hypothetical protein